MRIKSPHDRIDILCKDEDPDLFQEANLQDSMTARKVCAICPAKEDCLQYAIDIHPISGIWGGTSLRDRNVILGHAQPAGRPLTLKAEYLDKIKFLVKIGMTDAAIGRRFGVTRTAIGHFRRRHGIPPNRQRKSATPKQCQSKSS